MEEMSNLKLVAQIVGGIAIVFLMTVLALTLVYFIIPEIHPDTRLYIGLVALISLNVAVVLGYVRFQRWRSFGSRGNGKPDNLQSAAKHRPF